MRAVAASEWAKLLQRCGALREGALSIRLSRTEVLRRVGPRFCQTGSARTRRRALEAVDVALDTARPRAWYGAQPLHGGTEESNADFLSLLTPKLRHVFRRCHGAIIFAMTLGPDLDAAIQRAQDADAARGFILDDIASRVAEIAAERVRTHVRELLPKGMAATPRYSPGYCDLPVSRQRSLFRLFPERPVGIGLSGNFLMSPRKSVSGFMGIGHDAIVREYGVACKRCEKTDCPHRRAP